MAAGPLRSTEDCSIGCVISVPITIKIIRPVMARYAVRIVIHALDQHRHLIHHRNRAELRIGQVVKWTLVLFIPIVAVGVAVDPLHDRIVDVPQTPDLLSDCIDAGIGHVVVVDVLFQKLPVGRVVHGPFFVECVERRARGLALDHTPVQAIVFKLVACVPGLAGPVFDLHQPIPRIVGIAIAPCGGRLLGPHVAGIVIG
ncbi:MAG: hypothetical protein D8M59_07400 [Planctomycetes bacterium]|nr:hypothetical protein [Planctomycetota bacterium]